MGNSASSTDEVTDENRGSHSHHQYYTGADDEDEGLDQFDGIDTLGYRVLGVQPDSPAASAGLVSFLDFLVGADNKMLLDSGEELEPGQEYDDVDLPALLAEKKGHAIEFLVWNIKSQSARLVDIIPNDNWGGAGLLGVTIRLDNYAGAEDRLVRVLSIESPKSPATIAGLVPEKDFLLGTSHQTLDSVDRLASLLRQHEDEIVELYVFNTDEDRVRVVSLLPTSNWEGSRGGLLGAEVGTGYLHRLPHASRNTSGSSVERRVRYVEPVQQKGASIDHNKSSQQQHESVGMMNDSIKHAVLELEPQLEMEPGEDEDYGGRRPHVSPSTVGMATSATHQTNLPDDAKSKPISTTLVEPTNAQGVPVHIFTPAVPTLLSGPPKAPSSGDGMRELSAGGGGTKYPASAAIPVSITSPARSLSGDGMVVGNNPPSADVQSYRVRSRSSSGDGMNVKYPPSADIPSSTAPTRTLSGDCLVVPRAPSSGGLKYPPSADIPSYTVRARTSSGDGVGVPRAPSSGGVKYPPSADIPSVAARSTSGSYTSTYPMPSQYATAPPIPQQSAFVVPLQPTEAAQYPSSVFSQPPPAYASLPPPPAAHQSYSASENYSYSGPSALAYSSTSYQSYSSAPSYGAMPPHPYSTTQVQSDAQPTTMSPSHYTSALPPEENQNYGSGLAHAGQPSAMDYYNTQQYASQPGTADQYHRGRSV